MNYTPGDAPELVEGQRVYVTIPQAGPDLIIKGKIVGIASIDKKIFPNYLVQCTDGQFPNATYPYSTFVYPLGQIDLDEEGS